MKAFLAAIALAISGAYAQDTFTVNTPPSAVVCQPLLISWVGGTAPFFLSILPGNQPGAAALVDFGTIDSGSSFSWPAVTLPAGTLIGINLRDSTGTLVQSAPFPINPGSDTSCLNATTTSSGSTTTRPTTSGTGTTTTSTTSARPTTSVTTTATTPRPTTTSTTPGTTPTGSATTGGAAPLNTNAASKLSQVGFAGIAGVVAAALLV